MRILFLTNNMQELKFDVDEITFGRAEDNLLQIDIPGVSRYHGKITKNLDTHQYFISDNQSTNGVLINGIRIEGVAEVKEGDIITLNDVRFQLLDLYNHTKTEGKIQLSEVTFEPTKQPKHVAIDRNAVTTVFTPATLNKPETAPHADDKEFEIKDLTEYIKSNKIFNKATNSSNKSTSLTEKEKGKSRFSNRFFYLILLCFLISGFAIFFIFSNNNKKSSLLNATNSDATAQVAKANHANINIMYTKEFITKDNVFKFSLLIENNKAYFVVDDLKSQLCVGPIEKPLSEIDSAKLRQAIQSSGFLDLIGDSIGLETSAERESRELSVFWGKKNNQIKVVNSTSPREFLDLEDAIVDFINSCELSYLILSPDELKEEAKNSFYRAEELFANYEADQSNLKEAIREYGLVLEYLKGFSPEPEVRKVASRKLNQAKEIREKLFNDLKSEYITYLNKNDLVNARKSLADIMKLVDDNSREYELTKNDYIKIDSRLRNQHNNRGSKK